MYEALSSYLQGHTKQLGYVNVYLENMFLEHLYFVEVLKIKPFTMFFSNNE